MLPDDWNSHGNIPGEKLIMRIDQVHFQLGFLSCTGLFSTRHVQVAWLRGENAIPGILVMTSYQVYFEPLNRQELKMGGAVVSFHFCAN